MSASEMFQLTFSDQSMRELNKLSAYEQLLVMERLTSLNTQRLKKPSGDLGKLQREGKTFYRLRSGDLRIYFEEKESGILFSHYIIPKHSFTDFVVRFKLPVNEETLAEEHQSFWKYLESLK